MTKLHNRNGLFLIIKGIEETCPRKQVSDMSHTATSAQNRADALIAGGQHAAFAFSTRNQKHLFSNPGMLSNLVLRHWHVYRV